jgi:peptide/nickel transport system substrate-binding protein
LPFAAGYNPPAPFEPNFVPGSFPDIDALVAKARGAATQEKRTEASHRAQRLLWEKGNQIGPVFVPGIDAHTSAVRGVRSLQFPDLTAATIAK